MREGPGANRRSGSRGIYREVYEHFADLINCGQLRPGDRVPSSSAVAHEWNISHATAAKAMELLRRDGYVQSTSKGTVVLQGNTPRMLSVLCEALNELEGTGQQLRVAVNEHGTFILALGGRVWRNEETQRWESLGS
jgi:DNA-binding transcriptional MocR family regulator